MDWPLAPVPQVEEPRQTGERGFGDRALHIEKEDRFGNGRPPFGQAEPSVLAHPLAALSSTIVSNEVDKVAGLVGRPVSLEINQEGRPLAEQPVLLKVG